MASRNVEEETSNNYSQHSFYQKMAGNVAKEAIHVAIKNNLNIKSLTASSPSPIIKLADLGCSVGPNTFASIQGLIHVIKQAHQAQYDNNNNPQNLEFQVYFNDLHTNDFNSLFAAIPPSGGYFAAGVPGSFHERLFPEASIHVVQVYYSIHWLSEAPQFGDSPNRGRIHYAGACDAVLEAYKEQWRKDFERFLAARAAEVVGGGMVIVVGPSLPDGLDYSILANGIMFGCMGSILVDLAHSGVITEEEVDSFNLPIYMPPPQEFESAVAQNGQFTIVAAGMTNPAPWLTEGVHVDMVEYTSHIRAAMEGMFLCRFPTQVVGLLFDRLAVKLSELSEEMESAYKDKIQAHFVLRRNY
ncbi:Loganic acid O-methyltransferase [Linum perenne]